jgi:hypothetical protein
MDVNGQFHAPAALPPGKSSLYPLDRRLGGPQSRSGRGVRSTKNVRQDIKHMVRRPVGLKCSQRTLNKIHVTCLLSMCHSQVPSSSCSSSDDLSFLNVSSLSDCAHCFMNWCKNLAATGSQISHNRVPRKFYSFLQSSVPYLLT